MFDFIDHAVILLTKRMDRLLKYGEELKKINFVEKDCAYCSAKEAQILSACGYSLSHATLFSEVKSICVY